MPPVQQRRRPFARLFDNRATLILTLLAPVIIFFIVFNTIPTLWLLGLSFYNFSLTSGMPPEFVGFRNFFAILASKNGIWFDLSRTFTLSCAASPSRPSSARCSASCSGGRRTCRAGASP